MIGWIEEILGVNCQEQTREELRVSLQEALGEIIDLNRHAAREAPGEPHEEAQVMA